jgi:hypothetical protein
VGSIRCPFDHELHGAAQRAVRSSTK